jgi:membrane associated rhomboid family serine protease
MFFPIRDDNPTRGVAWVTYALMATNVAVHIALDARALRGEFWLTAWYGLVPSRFFADPSGEALTVLTSMFMHGGWMHLASNMWFLHIFGDNLEDALGRGRYVLFYLAAGVGAAAAQVLIDPASRVPMVGASGAIAGVVGGYMVLYPRAPIVALNTFPPLWLFLGVFVVLPAWVIALVFFGQNLLMGTQALGDIGGAGVAFFAHIGGFVAGLALVRPLLGKRSITPRVWGGWSEARSQRFRRR